MELMVVDKVRCLSKHEDWQGKQEKKGFEMWLKYGLNQRIVLFEPIE